MHVVALDATKHLLTRLNTLLFVSLRIMPSNFPIQPGARRKWQPVSADGARGRGRHGGGAGLSRWITLDRVLNNI